MIDPHREQAKEEFEAAAAMLQKINSGEPLEDGETPIQDDEGETQEIVQEVAVEEQEEEPGEPEYLAEPEEDSVEPLEEVVPAHGGTVSRAEYEALQHKYDVLQGMHDSQVVQVAAENRTLRADIRDLNAENSRLAEVIQGLQKNTVKEEVGDLAFSSFGQDPGMSALVDQFGEEPVKAIFDRINSSLVPVMAEIKTMKKSLEDTAQVTKETAAKTEFDRFLDSLRGPVPDWEQINASDGFKRYLLELVPGTGMTRDAFLQMHLKGRSLKALAQIFIDYKRGLSNGKGKEIYTPKPLREQVSPSKGRSVTQSTKGKSAEIWTPARVNAFIDYEMGHAQDFEGKKLDAQQVRRLKQNLVLAKAEGRYRE